MIQKHFEDIIRKKFGYDFSPTQQIAVEHFIRFFFAREEEGIFLLKGYAGTGKTSLVAAIVNALVSLEYKVVLLAPTGRAAKVFAGYAGQAAFTIHKKIYRQKSSTDGEGLFNLGFNAGADTLFFVDEASMISNADGEGNFGSGCLLDDLIQYIYNGRNNRLILIGDVAQLPPVGLDISPALDRRELEAAYNFKVTEVALTDIMRQAEQSGILYIATQVRSLIGIGSENLRLRIGKFPDVFKIGGGELLEEIDSCYGRFGEEETIVVCRSNKRANRFNEGIRRTILYREEDFCSGDRIMIVKNNYFWGADYEKIDFIRFPKFFGKAYQVLVFLALIFGVVISGLSTMGRPSQCKSNGPPGVYGRVKILAEAVSKYFSEEAKCHGSFSDVVSMREEETFSPNFGYQGSVVYRNAQFMREIIENPDVVVPDKPVYVNVVVA